MWVYYFIFLVIALSAFMTGKNRQCAVMGFLAFAILYILRARIGTDYPGYKIYYESMNGLEDLATGGFELGYNMLALIFREIGLPFQSLCVFLSIIIIFFYWKSMKKLCRKKLEFGIIMLLALYYFFYPTLEILRQGTAITLFLYSLTFLLDENPKMRKNNVRIYFLLNFAGVLFHRTAIMAFIFYFFQEKRVMKIGIILFLIFFALMQPMLLQFLGWFPTFYNRYYHYVWAKNASKKEVSDLSLKLIEYVIVLLILLRFSLKERKIAIREEEYVLGSDNRNLDSIETLSRNLVELGLIVQFFVSTAISAAYRLVYYCDLGIMFFYIVIHQRLRREERLLYIVVLITYVGVRLGRIFPFDNNLFTYHFLW